jgi:hypothetical protein
VSAVAIITPALPTSTNGETTLFLVQQKNRAAEIPTPLAQALQAAEDCLDAASQIADLVGGYEPAHSGPQGIPGLSPDRTWEELFLGCGPSVLESLRLAVLNGQTSILPITRSLNAVAQEPPTIKLPPQNLDLLRDSLVESNVHETLLALADYVLSQVWRILDPSGFQQAQLTPDPLQRFDSNTLAQGLAPSLLALKPVLPTYDAVALRDACKRESARATFLALQQPPPLPVTATKEARHSPDFRSIHWFGVDYQFSGNQAACIRVLWKAWENKTPDVGQDRILEAAECVSKRLADVFKRHPAWKTLIVSKSRGTYRLQPPLQTSV